MTIAAILLWLRGVNWKVVGAVAVGLALLWMVYRTYNSIYNSGAAGVRNEINKTTVDALDKSRANREKNEDEIRRTPFNDRVDQLP